MNRNFLYKRLFSLFIIILAGTSQVFVARAQALTANKIGRNISAADADKQEPETSFVAEPTVYALPGNPGCKDLNPYYLEFNIDPPRSGKYFFAENQFVTANLYGGEDGLTFVDYHSNTQFIAVIVKGGNQGANVYSFNQGQRSVTGLKTPNLQDISHVTFCYLGTTAAAASLGGTVLSENGRGLPRSMATIQNLNTEETRTVITNSFGYYRFNALPVGDLYVVTITNKKAGFNRQTQSFVLNGDEDNLNFTTTAQ
jgi:hypothetical protein